jgi:hypothetical protein
MMTRPSHFSVGITNVPESKNRLPDHTVCAVEYSVTVCSRLLQFGQGLYRGFSKATYHAPSAISPPPHHYFFEIQ